MEYQFDVDAIISIIINDKQEQSYKWLPGKTIPRFFGLLKPTVYAAGFYDYGDYEGWKSGPYTKERMETYGYIVDEKNIVWSKPYVTVYLPHKYSVSKKFNTIEEAYEWVEELKATSGKTFEIVKY